MKAFDEIDCYRILETATGQGNWVLTFSSGDMLCYKRFENDDLHAIVSYSERRISIDIQDKISLTIGDKNGRS